MAEADEVTRWMLRLADGNQSAAQLLWQGYFDRLVGLAHRQLRGFPRRAADEEDVALSALESFCRGMAAGRFPHLEDRHSLWKLLVRITARKVIAQLRRQAAQKRGGLALRGESVFLDREDLEGEAGIAEVLGREPTPELACQVAETCREMLDRLGDDDLRRIALAKMEGHSNGEIARDLGCAVRTVERKLNRIQEKWERVIP
jgi:DNA-directed RNA polymerase specialized sigma24 family protein